MREYRMLKDEALDRNVWGIDFGRESGHLKTDCGVNERKGIDKELLSETCRTYSDIINTRQLRLQTNLL
jgi:hypothetical protein